MKLLDLKTPGNLPNAPRIRSLVVRALGKAQVYKQRTSTTDPALNTFIAFLEDAVTKAKALQ